MITSQQACHKIKYLMEDGLMDLLINQITNDVALEIVETSHTEMSKREELYMLTKALKRLNEKLQEYVNNYEIQENE